MQPTSTAPVPMRARVSEVEWQTRVDLAACYRLVAIYGMTDMIYNHITARVPGEEGHFLINPFGLLYEEITASCLIKIDLEGNVVGRPDGPADVNHAGYIIHSAVHGARHDVACVLHTHTRSGMAVSTLECGLMPATLIALRFHDSLAYHEFEGPAVAPDERARLVEDLGDKDAMVLRNHGLLTCGRSIPEAFLLMHRLESACRVQMDFLATGKPLHLPTAEVIARSTDILAPARARKRDGAAPPLGNWDGWREWAALLRQADRVDPSYRL